MCHLSSKFSDRIPELGKKLIIIKKPSHSLTLRAKVKVIAKIKSQCPREQNMPLKNFSRGSLTNWCDAGADADANADISKTICQQQGWVFNIIH